MLRKCDFDRAAVRQKGAGRLEPNQRSAQRCSFHLRNVIGVIQTDCDQFGRRNRNIDLQVSEFPHIASRCNLDPIRLRQHVHVLTAHFAIEEFFA